MSSTYVVVSADGHAGADILGYREYLAARWHDEFDAWAATFVNPYGDRLLSETPEANWNSDLRLKMLEADGVVAEVVFPNTVPPFFPISQVFVPPPPTTEVDYQRRWAGLQAHNRWMADFSAAAPGRRAGLAQIMLNDVDDAIAEVRWAKSVGLAGILMPGVPSGSHLPGVYAPIYEPLWSVCEELDIPLANHTGTGLADYGRDPIGEVMLNLEVTFFAHRPMWHLIFSGVFERHPNLKLVLTEQGTGWVPPTLRILDNAFKAYKTPGTSSNFFGGEAVKDLTKTPSEYFAQNIWIGASFIHPTEVGLRDKIGVDRIMWGQDFPHVEGTYPHSREAIQHAFSGVPEQETRMMLSENAAAVYGFDLDALRAPAARCGPGVDYVAAAPSGVPDSFCLVFAEVAPERL